MTNIIHPDAGNYFLDTEFHDPADPGFGITFFSIGLVSESGNSFYGVADDFDDEDPAYRDHWVYENVIKLLPPQEERIDLNAIQEGLLQNVFESGPKRIDIWAKNGAYDFYVLDRIFGGQKTFEDTLKDSFGIERVRRRDTNELLDMKPKQLILPSQNPATKHISIDDAKNEREVFLVIKDALENGPKPNQVFTSIPPEVEL